MVFIAQNSSAVHNDSGSYIRRSNETLGLGNAKPHPFSQNHGKEISDGVSVGGCQAEEGGEGPDFGVKGVFEIGGDVKGLGDGVMAVFFDSCDDEGGFGGGEEVEGGGRVFGEVDDEEVAS